MTQRGSWYPSGELVISSKTRIYGENIKNRQILLKIFTVVEFYGENDEMNRNIENLMTIALWEFCWSKVFNPLLLRIKRGYACYHGNSKKNIENEIIIIFRNKSRTVSFHNTENGKLKGHIP